MSKNKMKKQESELKCIAYLSVVGAWDDVEFRERKQLRYIREYATAHNITITKIMHRDVLGQMDVNTHFDRMNAMIRQGFVDGIIVANMMSVSSGISDAYLKAGKVAQAGGVLVTVDEGIQRLKIVGA